MSGAITWEALGLAIAGIMGVVLVLGGAFAAFAAGMSSNPAEGERVGRQGCFIAVAGLVVLALVLAGVVS